MKTQLNTWKFRTAVCLVALMLQTGCANKTNVAENEQVDGFAENGGQPAEGAETAAADTTATEAELFGEKTEAAGDPAANLAQNDPATAPTTGNPAMETLFAPNQDPNAAADPNFDELTGKTPGSDPALADAPVTSPAGSADPSVNADPLAGGNTSALQDPATPTDAQAFSGKPTFNDSKPKVAAVAPKIPGRAMTRKGVSLNRYYFLRQGNTSKSVSTLLYGDASHAASLKKWNKGNWMAGKVIYYPSATQADDAQMLSFYDERGLTPEDHKVGKGETMSIIAKKLLGSKSSWKEIAVVNGLTRPGGLKRGQTLKVFTNLTGGNAPTQVANSSESVTAPAQQTPPTPVPDLAQGQVPPVTGIAPTQPGAEDDLNQAKKKPAKTSVSLGKLISQNSFAIAMGLGIGLLMIALMMINKRKKGGGGGADEFSEDAFAAPEKKKRR
jgi:LysM repeat protein